MTPKRNQPDTKVQNVIKKKNRHRIIIENAPPVHSLIDLIKVGNTSKFYRNIDTVMLWRINPFLEELEEMIGMDTLKESIFYQIIYYLQGMHTHEQNDEYLHTIILGSPGSGKTTVARIIGKIYQMLGVLSADGIFKTAYRDDFIAEYLGQTAIKTRKLLNSCIGGVLFIDEIYSMGPGSSDKDSFSKEAIDTITAFLSEHKHDFCCIAAGYEEEIKKCFFSINQGLERRFPWVHKIDIYSSSELTKILIKMIDGMKWELGVDVDITKLIENNKDMFKSAGGDIETFLSKTKMVHARRVFNLDKKDKFILIQKDFENGIEIMKKYKLTTDSNIPPLGMYI
jgi:stage V sporulation protein K